MAVRQVHGKHAFVIRLKQGPRFEVSSDSYHVSIDLAGIGQVKARRLGFDGHLAPIVPESPA